MENPKTLLVTQTRVKPDKNDLFKRWLTTVDKAVAQFQGYQSSEVKEPNPPMQLDWIIIYSFANEEQAKKWLQSEQRRVLLKEALPLLVGIDNVYIMQHNAQNRHEVSATITNTIPATYEQQFLDWQMRIAAIQSTFPGFVGYKLERSNNNAWLTIVSFDSNEHLDEWLNSSQRQHMLEELYRLSKDMHVEKIYSGFNFWFNQTAQRTIWKENMLVLLTLYPVVFLLSFIQNPMMARGVPFWLALFFSNLISTIILGSVTVPWLMKRFQWWLNPPERAERNYTVLGTCTVLILYCISMVICWALSK